MVNSFHLYRWSHYEYVAYVCNMCSEFNICNNMKKGETNIDWENKRKANFSSLLWNNLVFTNFLKIFTRIFFLFSFVYIIFFGTNPILWTKSGLFSKPELGQDIVVYRRKYLLQILRRKKTSLSRDSVFDRFDCYLLTLK